MPKMIMMDFETMGTNVFDCAVIDFSIMSATTEKMLSDTPYTTRNIVDVKKFKLSVKDQIDNYGWKVYSDTVKFWSEQSPAAKKLIKPLETDISVKDFVSGLLEYLAPQGKIYRWWSRANTFDPMILWRIVEAQDKNALAQLYKILPHWQLREIRTYIDAKLDYPPENGFVPIADVEFWKKVFVQHDSSWDVLADILRMQAIIRAENELEQVKR